MFERTTTDRHHEPWWGMISSRVPDDSVGSQMALRGGVVDPVGRGAGEKKIDVPDQEKLEKSEQ